MTDVTAGVPTPAEVPAPGAQPVIAPDVPADQGNANEEPVKPPRTYSEEEHRKGISERLAKERRRLERTIRAEAERDFYKQQLEGRTAKPEGADAPKGKPKASEFQDPEEYLEALADYKLEERERKKAEKAETERKSSDDKRTQAERARFAEEKIFTPGMAKHRDFAEVVMREEVSLTDAMIAAAGRLKNGSDVIYHLGQNPEESHRIASLPDIEQVWEIKALESKLAAPPPVPKNPPPIVPNGANASAKKDWKDMSTKEHIEAYRKRPNR